MLKTKDRNSWESAQKVKIITAARIKKFCLAASLLLICILSLAYFTKILSVNSKDNKQLLQQIIFSSDGVLDAKWMTSVCKIRTGVELVSVDILSIKTALQRHSQVKAVVVERKFPDTIVVNIFEHKPVAKVFTRKNMPLLVSKDGVIFASKNYKNSKISKLITLTNLSKKFVAKNKILGFNSVYSLIKSTYVKLPELYYRIKFISLKNFDKENNMPWCQIKVMTKNNIEFIFSGSSIDEQLSKLQTILLQLNDDQRKYLESVNLSFKNPVIKIINKKK